MTMQQTVVKQYRRPRDQYLKRRDSERRLEPFPEYLEADEVKGLILAAPHSESP